MHSQAERSQQGTSLIETLIATAICTVVMFSLAAMMSTAVKQNKNQSSTVAQCTTLAAQKLDQLLEIGWQTGVTAPATLTAGGSLTSDTTGYVDYLDPTGGVPAGSPITSPTDARMFFTRRWLIEDLSGGTSKKITLFVFGRSVGRTSESSAPQATLACVKVQQ